jgi:hypothetical protein
MSEKTFVVDGVRYTYVDGALVQSVPHDPLFVGDDEALEARAISGEWAQTNASAATWRLVEGED